MAAASDLREELNCSVCLNIFIDPVLLSCGHNFCRVCIGNVLDTQGRSGLYTCPDCRAEFTERPALQRNMKLCNIAERFITAESDMEDSGIYCTYCVYAPVAAAKTCLHCEASLCETHLRAHAKSAQHILIEPTKSLEDRKCSVHKRFLEYYCSEDAVCICVSCRLDGEHRGHHVDTLSEASEKKKEKLTHVLEELTSKRQETQKKVQSLEDRRREAHDKAAEVTERVEALFRDIRSRLEFLEKRVLVEVSWQNVQALLKVSDLIRRLESQRDELSEKMRHVEELRNFTDPLTFLRGPDAEDSAAEPEKGDDDDESDVKDLDQVQIMLTLHSNLADIFTKINRGDSGRRSWNLSQSGHRAQPLSDLKMPPGHR